MSVVSVQPKDFILALFIRDDGERFLLGDNGYDFMDSQLHFVGNSIENDEVAKQGTDGVMLAGQVRRSAVQTFDGYVGDATTPKEEIEQMRRAFIAFFLKDHHYRVVYVDCARNAWQRKGGYLVDAPEVKELFQVHPEYHVGLNFEDVNYYSYDENAEGDEITANLVQVAISSAVEGGLVWDEDGAVSEDATVVYDGDTATASGKSISIADAVNAPLASFQLDGETSQNGTPTPDAPVAVQTVTGENVVKICGKNIADIPDFSVAGSGYAIGASDGAVSVDSTTTNRAISLCSGTDGGAWLPAYTSSSVIDHHITGNGGSYTISLANVAKTITGSQAFYVSVYTNKRSVANTTLTSSSNFAPSTITLDSDEHIKDIWIWVGSNTTYNASFNMQLEKGSTATAYEPYQEQSYEVNLYDNLYDKSQAVKSAANISLTMAIDPNTSYIFNTGRTWTTVHLYNSSNVKTRTLGNAGSYRRVDFTTTASEVKAEMTFYVGSATSIETYDFTGVEFYKPEDAIELCKIGTYQDYIYKSGDKWYKHAEIGKTDLANYNYTVASAVLRRTTAIPNMKYVSANTEVGSAIAEKYIIHEGRGMSSANLAGYMAVDVSMFAVNVGTSDTSVNPTGLLYYALATPTDTEITNATLVGQLEAILAGGTFAGTNNIALIPSGNEQGSLEITYYTKYIVNITAGGYEWEQGGSGGPTIVMNESIDNVYPIWTITGPITNPVLENTTTGEQIEYVGTIGEGQKLIIDMGAQTALLDGLNVLSNVVGEFISLAPGANTLLYSVSNGDTASEIGWSEIVG